MNYQGKLYRALNPIYAREPFSGRDAEINGDRFKPNGTAALYLATSFRTAIKEANQVGDLQPTTIVSYKANIEG
ncbi:RES domain-containing protein [Novosphingobium sp. YAF33]|uniref:RES domain-containing protein n=1 Tax=Novosphingobium sp. YAF33 TaxID=3233082 RepID=UPI003F98942D